MTLADRISLALAEVDRLATEAEPPRGTPLGSPEHLLWADLRSARTALVAARLRADDIAGRAVDQGEADANP
jgi:hypothetical protein